MVSGVAQKLNALVQRREHLSEECGNPTRFPARCARMRDIWQPISRYHLVPLRARADQQGPRVPLGISPSGASLLVHKISLE